MLAGSVLVDAHSCRAAGQCNITQPLLVSCEQSRSPWTPYYSRHMLGGREDIQSSSEPSPRGDIKTFHGGPATARVILIPPSPRGRPLFLRKNQRQAGEMGEMGAMGKMSMRHSSGALGHPALRLAVIGRPHKAFPSSARAARHPRAQKNVASHPPSSQQNSVSLLSFYCCCRLSLRNPLFLPR